MIYSVDTLRLIEFLSSASSGCAVKRVFVIIEPGESHCKL